MQSHIIYHLTPPIIFGHRGASKYAPENTLASFILAFALGASAIELDVTLSSDQEVVVIHDHTLDRTTTGHGQVNEYKLSELKKLDAGSKYSKKYTGERIPTLDEALDIINDDRLVNIELKKHHSVTDRFVQIVCDKVCKSNKNNSILFSSFSPMILLEVRRILPGIPLALITDSGVLGKLGNSLFLRWLTPDFIHPQYPFIDADFIKKEHSRNRRVNVWTVDKKEDLDRLFSAKVDGVITNDPALAIDEKNSRTSHKDF